MTEKDLGKQEHGIYADYEACKAAFAEAVNLMDRNGTPRAVVALYTSLAKTFFAENDLVISSNYGCSLPPYLVHSDGTVASDTQVHFQIGMNQHTGEIKVEPPYRGSYDHQVIEGRERIRIAKGSEETPGSIIDCDILGRLIGKPLTIEEIARIAKASYLIRKIYEKGGRSKYSAKEWDQTVEGYQRLRFPSLFAKRVSSGVVGIENKRKTKKIGAPQTPKKLLIIKSAAA